MHPEVYPAPRGACTPSPWSMPSRTEVGPETRPTHRLETMPEVDPARASSTRPRQVSQPRAELRMLPIDDGVGRHAWRRSLREGRCRVRGEATRLRSSIPVRRRRQAPQVFRPRSRLVSSTRRRAGSGTPRRGSAALPRWRTMAHRERIVGTHHHRRDSKVYRASVSQRQRCRCTGAISGHDAIPIELMRFLRISAHNRWGHPVYSRGQLTRSAMP